MSHVAFLNLAVQAVSKNVKPPFSLDSVHAGLEILHTPYNIRPAQLTDVKGAVVPCPSSVINKFLPFFIPLYFKIYLFKLNKNSLIRKIFQRAFDWYIEHSNP